MEGPCGGSLTETLNSEKAFERRRSCSRLIQKGKFRVFY
jgi:hypothetical protein